MMTIEERLLAAGVQLSDAISGRTVVIASTGLSTVGRFEERQQIELSGAGELTVDPREAGTWHFRRPGPTVAHNDSIIDGEISWKVTRKIDDGTNPTVRYEVVKTT